MKKIIIVNNNMRVGGVQKSLYNLLWTMHKEQKYDVTLLLFRKTGSYVENLPDSVKVIECGGPFKYMGESQSFFKHSLKDSLMRGTLASISRLFGHNAAVRLMLIKQPKLSEKYDCAISYLHNGRKKSFYGGVQDYVLNCIDAERKIAFLHCDYSKCGSNHSENNRMMAEFDKIAACSDGCGQVFESVLGDLKGKSVTVRNCHLFEEIKALADDNTVIYDESSINVITVARLSSEKGIDRAIKAVFEAIAKGIPIKLHIVGNGALYDELASFVKDKGITDNVIFYGEQQNPYRYIKNADLLLIPSYHEAAPMVIDEARCLGVPLLSTETTSSKEMIIDEKCGWVCENSQEALNEALYNLTSNRDLLVACKQRISENPPDNSLAVRQFESLVED